MKCLCGLNLGAVGLAIPGGNTGNRLPNGTGTAVTRFSCARNLLPILYLWATIDTPLELADQRQSLAPSPHKRAGYFQPLVRWVRRLAFLLWLPVRLLVLLLGRLALASALWSASSLDYSKRARHGQRAQKKKIRQSMNIFRPGILVCSRFSQPQTRDRLPGRKRLPWSLRLCRPGGKRPRNSKGFRAWRMLRTAARIVGRIFPAKLRHVVRLAGLGAGSPAPRFVAWAVTTLCPRRNMRFIFSDCRLAANSMCARFTVRNMGHPSAMAIP